MTQATCTAPTAPRRHDLDALRAVAMLLGIVLHAALPYLGGEATGVLVPILDVIHGFRMPLFFLLSGFFTAMLWRRRGIIKLVRHRFRRILLPLVVFTPIVILAFIGAAIVGAVVTFEDKAELVAEEDEPVIQVDQRVADERSILWGAVYAGDVATLERLLLATPDLEVDVLGDDAWRPLHLATLLNYEEAVIWLIDNGANVTAQTAQGWTALDIASANEHTAIVAILRENGAVTGSGDTAEIPIIGEDDRTEEDEGLNFMHLWFLWFLWWLVVGFALIAFIIQRLPLPRIPSRWVVTPLRYVWLLPLTMLFQFRMDVGSFGPDTHTGAAIPGYLLLYYGVFFGFGVLYYHYQDEAADAGRGWWLLLPVSVFVLYPLTGGMMQDATRWTLPAALVMTTYTWLMTFAFIGLFRAWFSQENQAMRYISDSSYFLYIFHLPLIILIAGVLGNWGVPDLLKFVVVVVLTTVILLLIYEIAVRYSFIGRFLNGPRQRPEKGISVPAAADTATPG